MQLNSLVAAYVPRSLRHSRDFESGVSWVHLANALIRRFEREGLFQHEMLQEVPVFIENAYYPNEIFLPSDCKKALQLYKFDSTYPEDNSKKYDFHVINGRLRLRSAYDDTALYSNSDYDKQQIGGTADATHAEGITDSGGFAAGSTDNALQWYGVWFQTANLHSDATLIPSNLSCVDCRLVYRSTATNGSVYWRPSLPSAPSVGEYAYFFSDFLMLRYEKTYATLSAYDDEIPIDDGYEEALGLGLRYMACPRQAKELRRYKDDFEEAVALIGIEVFTPSIYEGGFDPRPFPDFGAEPDSGGAVQTTSDDWA